MLNALRRKLQLPGNEASPRARHRAFMLRVVQPGLVGLMDGSVSTLAPIFASALATRDPFVAFLVGLAASLGAAISMGLSEALSDTGALTDRGDPLWRGIITGGATFVGGILHALPFLIPHVTTAVVVAVIAAALELVAIAYIRYRYMQMGFWSSFVQVVIGGVIVLGVGVLVGEA